MKTLEINQMECVQGGVSNRECMLAGAAAYITLVASIYNPSFLIGLLWGVTNYADCLP